MYLAHPNASPGEKAPSTMAKTRDSVSRKPVIAAKSEKVASPSNKFNIKDSPTGNKSLVSGSATNLTNNRTGTVRSSMITSTKPSVLKSPGGNESSSLRASVASKIPSTTSVVRKSQTNLSSTTVKVAPTTVQQKTVMKSPIPSTVVAPKKQSTSSFTSTARRIPGGAAIAGTPAKTPVAVKISPKREASNPFGALM